MKSITLGNFLINNPYERLVNADDMFTSCILIDSHRYQLIMPNENIFVRSDMYFVSLICSPDMN